MKTIMGSLPISSVDNLLMKIQSMVSRPSPELNKFKALELLEALKNVAQDVKHEKMGYFRLTFETWHSMISQLNKHFQNFFLLLLGDKDHEKSLRLWQRLRRLTAAYKGNREGINRCSYSIVQK